MPISPERLILGCGNFGGLGSSPELFGRGETEEEARALLKDALFCGIRSFDTAHSYGGGHSEAVLGRFLQGLPRAARDNLQVATKIGNPHGTLPGRRPLEASEVERQLTVSLMRLKCESVDILYLHEPDRATPLEETFAALEPHLERGQFKAIGLSNVSLADVQLALAAASTRLRSRIRFVQNEYHYLNAGDAAPNPGTPGSLALIPFLHGNAIAYVSFSPLAGGLLTGKYSGGCAPPAGSRLALLPEPYVRFLSAESFDRIDELAAEATRLGETLPEAALRFALAGADFAVIGPRRSMQLRALLSPPPSPKAAARADLPGSV